MKERYPEPPCDRIATWFVLWVFTSAIALALILTAIERHDAQKTMDAVQDCGLCHE